MSSHLGVAPLPSRAQGFQELTAMLKDCVFGEIPVAYDRRPAQAVQVVAAVAGEDVFGFGRHRSLVGAEQGADDQERKPKKPAPKQIDAVVPDRASGLQAGAYEFADEPVPSDDLDLLRVQVRRHQ
ncbi:hypothetical protein ACIO8F_41840 [Streptomyces sp. NPDC087228]|uniref:hypothetical protein n=1 Tax=unclassified Streptomyces TaxID=2593676 RepID=UPI0037F22821